tara:strand:- start:424 stop:735 length:312 start_codon:yes stop_codon:yes gene_type:complete
MDFYISVYTLKKLDNIINDYKQKILRDFYELNELKCNYQEFENKILERKTTKPFIKNNEIDYNKCHAFIWKKNYGKVQCGNKHYENNLCKKHLEKQNYGIVNN